MEKKNFEIIFGRWSNENVRISVIVDNVHKLQGALCCLNSDSDYRLYDVVQLV